MLRIHPAMVPCRWLSLVAALLLLCGGRTLAASDGVRDAAHFFSPNAIHQAGQIIQQIQQRHHKDLLIESVPDIPQDMRDQFQQQGKNPFFQQWAEDRARTDGVNGVYVLICRNPAHLEVVAGTQTEQRLFTMTDRDALSRQLLSAFRQKKYDQGLVDGSRFVLDRMDAHGGQSSAGRGAAVPPAGYPGSNYPGNGVPRGWGPMGGIACTIIAVVLFLILVRGVFGRSGGGYRGGGYPPGGSYPPGAYPPGSYPPGSYPPGYGGGGFGRGFLGGLLGGALGGYAADRWLGHEQQQGGGYTPPPAAGSDPGSGVDTSYNATGGDFGDTTGGAPDSGDSGGADFGGGDGGGGDFGGGDGGGDGGASSGGDF